MSNNPADYNSRMEKINNALLAEVKKTPTPLSILMYFFIVTIFYGFFIINNVLNSKDMENSSEKSNNVLYDIIYILILLTGTIYLNVNISKIVCNSNKIKWGDIFLLTIIPWIIIFGLIYFLLELFPGWIKPFSNTIGYFIINSLGASDKLDKILKDPNNETDKTLKQALINIDINKTKFINEMSDNQIDYGKLINQLVKEKFTNNNINENDEDVISLFNMIVIKKLIGKYVWYILSGMLIASITYNNVINITCEKTVFETKQEYDDIYSNNTLTLYGTTWNSVTEQRIRNLEDKTNEFDRLINTYFERFNNNDVTFTSDELRRVGIIYELENDIYIKVNNKYFIPTS